MSISASLSSKKPLVRILISGGSIAGYSLAYFLSRQTNVHITLIERAPSFREGGQNVDIRSTARRIVRDMGLEAALLAANTTERGFNFVNEQNDSVALFDLDKFGANGLTAEMEILRGDLARILRDHCQADNVTMRYGQSITHVCENDDGVDVSFAAEKEEKETFDMLVVAEGVGSYTRDKVLFPGLNKPRHMDLTMAFFTMPKGEEDKGDFARWYTARGGRSIFLRPDNQGTTRACMTFYDAKHTKVHSSLTVEEQKALLITKFANAGWETERVLQGVRDADDLYLDCLRQIKLPQWHTGKRAVLTGDAAWCVTPFAGIGTSLALIGSYVLTGELVKAQFKNVDKAFEAYEAAMRPLVNQSQNFPKFMLRVAHPDSRWGLFVFRTMLRFFASPPIVWLMQKWTPREGGDNFKIPAYSGLSIQTGKKDE